MKPKITIETNDKHRDIHISKLRCGHFAVITSETGFKNYIVFGMEDRVALLSTGGYIVHTNTTEFSCRPLEDGEVITLTF